MANIETIRETLARHRSEFTDRFRVRRLAVFGSYARGDQRPDSDVDILVDFDSSVGIEFIDLGNYLERILNLRVDLVSRKGIKQKYYDRIKDELQYV